jgi:hypothetical protein
MGNNPSLPASWNTPALLEGRVRAYYVKVHTSTWEAKVCRSKKELGEIFKRIILEGVEYEAYPVINPLLPMTVRINIKDVVHRGQVGLGEDL